MAVAQGTCPGCGAPIEFGVGSSIAKVCEYCSSTVVRTDRGLADLGKVAALAETPSLIAVGDEGSLGGRPFQVMGRVQLDHGQGPWDEYYVSFDYGQAWGWLAYAQGHWYVTSHVPGHVTPAYDALEPEMDVPLGNAGMFRVAEVKQGTVVSGEGEQPNPLKPGAVRYYADCYGPGTAFATLDYGDKSGAAEVYLGWIFSESQMQVTQLGPRSTNKVQTNMIRCPNCGGDVPKLSGDRAQRLGCPYCGAVSEIATQHVVAQQEAAMRMPDIPLGSQGTFDGSTYVCIAYLRRGTEFDGEHYSWEEFLLWSQGLGFRWLVKDPETGWSWVVPANLAEVDLRGLPNQVAWGGRVFQLRNNSSATVEYVLGEVFWKCEVGETTRVMDFVAGRDVLSREHGRGEVSWSYTSPLPWSVIAAAFGLPVDGAGAYSAGGGGASAAAIGGGRSGCASTILGLIIISLVLLVCMLGACGTCASGSSTGSGYRGGGIYYGGK